jgi:hypothetical protein
MGEDREVREGGDAGLTLTPWQVFTAEVSRAVRYERFLVPKAGIALAVVGLVILARLAIAG